MGLVGEEEEEGAQSYILLCTVHEQSRLKTAEIVDQ